VQYESHGEVQRENLWAMSPEFSMHEIRIQVSRIQGFTLVK